MKDCEVTVEVETEGHKHGDARFSLRYTTYPREPLQKFTTMKPKTFTICQAIATDEIVVAKQSLRLGFGS